MSLRAACSVLTGSMVLNIQNHGIVWTEMNLKDHLARVAQN